VGRLFGSLGLYQRTAFISQKATRNCPDLSAATKGERKELFSELCGIDWLAAYHDAAKEHSDAVSREIERIEARHSLLVGAQDRCAALHSEIEQHAATTDEKDRAGKLWGLNLALPARSYPKRSRLVRNGRVSCGNGNRRSTT